MASTVTAHATTMRDRDREGAGKRALVTGLCGFTGRYVADELRAAGYEVFGTALAPEPRDPAIFAVDICDRAAVARLIEQVQPDVVVHLAAIAFVAHADIEQIYRVNVVGTRNLLEALAEQSHKPSAVLLVSSANVYGNACSGRIDESVAPEPANEYAVSKLAMEYVARLWQERLPIVIVRPFNYTGVGQHENFLLPKIVGHFRRRADTIELGNLDVARDFSDVRVVAATYRRLLHLAPVGEVFNVASGTATSLRSVIDTVAAIAGYQIDVRVNPAFVRANEVLTLVGSSDKLKAAIGNVEPIPLNHTLRWMMESP